MWVLLEESDGKKRYFKGWSDYMPVTTDNLREAMRFDSKRDATLSQAYRFQGSSFVPVEVELAVKNKAAA